MHDCTLAGVPCSCSSSYSCWPGLASLHVHVHVSTLTKVPSAAVPCLHPCPLGLTPCLKEGYTATNLHQQQGQHSYHVDWSEWVECLRLSSTTGNKAMRCVSSELHPHPIPQRINQAWEGTKCALISKPSATHQSSMVTSQKSPVSQCNSPSTNPILNPIPNATSLLPTLSLTPPPPSPNTTPAHPH